MESVSLEKKFLELLVGLEAVEFIGLCKFLGVRLIEENSEAAPRKDNNEAKELEAEEVEVEEVEETISSSSESSSGVQGAAPQNCVKPLDFTDLLSQLMEKFSKLSRTRKRELIKILKKVNK